MTQGLSASQRSSRQLSLRCRHCLAMRLTGGMWTACVFVAASRALAPHRSPCPLPVPASPRGTSPWTPGRGPPAEAADPKGPLRGSQAYVLQKAQTQQPAQLAMGQTCPRGRLSAPGVPSQPPGSPPSPRGPLPAPGIPSQTPGSPLGPQHSLSAPGVLSQPPGSPLSPRHPLSAPGGPPAPPPTEPASVSLLPRLVHSDPTPPMAVS